MPSGSGFNYDTATPREILAEADRRCRNRLAGRAVTDDGPDSAIAFDALPAAERKRFVDGNWMGGRRPDGNGRGVKRPPDVPGSEQLPIALPEQPVLTEIKLVLPWSTLLADNRKYAPALNKQKRATIILTQDYRTAKRRAEQEIDKQLAGLKPIIGPVSLVGRFHEPDRRTRRDISNYAKLIQDALNGRAYLDDSLLDDVHWIRCLMDVDRPRLELEISSLVRR